MNIRVALTTTRFITRSDTSLELSNRFRDMDIPVCIAEMRLGLFGDNLEGIEHQMAQSALELAKKVEVDSDSKSVFIGGNPLVEDTGLVTYQEQNLSITSESFFGQWEKTHILVFEFHVLNMMNEDPRYVVHGIWDHGRWTHLEIIPSPKIRIEEKL